jgi:L-ascorbate metabolism protein UlaG (beta-lactamase superfamily)
VDEVRELLAATLAKRARNIEFAESVVGFANRLTAEATGQSLEPFYERVPEPLRGYVELVYDYYNRASVRFLEGLLYRSSYYDASLQSLRISRLAQDTARPFFMSTPRLLNEGEIEWTIPFEDGWVDELFRLDICPQPLGQIREILGLDARDEDRLLPFLSSERRRSSAKWEQSRIRIRYFGHACVLLEWNGVSILTDPYVGARPTGGGMQRLSYDDLPETIDFALVTHNHQDHFALETLLRLRHRIGCLVVPKSSGLLYGDPSLKLLAQRIGFKHVAELDALESLPLPDGEIIAAPFLGEHADLNHGKAAYVVRAGREQILFGADSNCLDQRIYQNLRSALGRIETVFLGMECVGAPLSWSCGPLFPKKPEHAHEHTRRYRGCDAKAALEILETVGAKRIYNYAMGQEPWVEFLLGLGLAPDSTQIQESDALLAATREKNFLASERLLGQGELFIDEASAEESARQFVQDVDEVEGLSAPTIVGNRVEVFANSAAVFVGGSDAEDQFVF